MVYAKEIVVPIEHFEEGDLSLPDAEGNYTPEEAVFHLRPAGGPPAGNEHYLMLPRH